MVVVGQLCSSACVPGQCRLEGTGRVAGPNVLAVVTLQTRNVDGQLVHGPPLSAIFARQYPKPWLWVVLNLFQKQNTGYYL